LSVVVLHDCVGFCVVGYGYVCLFCSYVQFCEIQPNDWLKGKTAYLAAVNRLARKMVSEMIYRH